MSVNNGEKYLREAVDSILAQTLTDFEFIIVDDGSTDGTVDILRTYSDPRIRTVRQENRGLTKSLNRGIGVSRGEFIARQDADDRSFPERLATQLEFLSSHAEIAMVGSAVEVISGNGKGLATFRHPTDPVEIRDALRTYNCFWHGSVMFRRESFLALGGYCEEFTTAQDYDLWLRFSERYQLANLPDPYYAYRFTTDSITVKKMVSQHRLAALARQRAAEREDNLSGENAPQKIPVGLTAPLTPAEKREIIGNYKPWCRLLLKNGLYDEAGQLMTELFRYHPSTLFRLSFRVGRHLNPQSNLSRFLEHA
jgi:glycosyltransferase involved in cell wall biosynthesis